MSECAGVSLAKAVETWMLSATPENVTALLEAFAEYQRRIEPDPNCSHCQRASEDLVETVMRVLDEHPDCSFRIVGNTADFECGIEVPGELVPNILHARSKHVEIALSKVLEGSPRPQSLSRVEALVQPSLVPCYVTRNAAMPCTSFIGSPFGNGTWLEAMCCLPCLIRAALRDAP